MVSSNNNKAHIRVRMAPSPTGFLHVGNARTALFNFLFARNAGGTVVLRVEDTDRERFNKEWEDNIFEGLKWLGLGWDEGPVYESDGTYTGEFGPYRQSERMGIYKKYIERLLADGGAFYCGHSKEELEREQEEQRGRKEAPRHVCAFREKDIAESDKGDAVIRFKNPGGLVTFCDAIRGDISFDAGLLGDFSIARNPESPLYNFAVIIDDYEMKITHVIRGEDHISNTPKQILVQQALDFPIPMYAHLPLILGTDRSKLSKRHGAVAVTDYRDMGYLPEALVNFLALLGWNPDTTQEIMPMEELIRRFSLANIQQSGAVFNVEKLDWMNGAYIRAMSLEQLTARCIPYLEKAGLIAAEGSRFVILDSKETVDAAWISKIIALEQPRMKRLNEIGERAAFFFKEKLDYKKELLVWKKMTDETLRETLNSLESFIREIPEKDFQSAKKLEERLMPLAERGEDRGVFLWPLRVVLSGQKASPGPFEIMEILGKEIVLKRLEQAKSLVD